MASSNGQPPENATDANDTPIGGQTLNVVTPVTLDADVVNPDGIDVQVPSGGTLDSMDDVDTDFQLDATQVGGNATPDDRVQLMQVSLTPREATAPRQIYAIDVEDKKWTDAELIQLPEREYNQISMIADDRDVRDVEQEGPDLRHLGNPTSLLRVTYKQAMRAVKTVKSKRINVEPD